MNVVRMQAKGEMMENFLNSANIDRLHTIERLDND